MINKHCIRELGNEQWQQVLSKFTLVLPDIYYSPQYYKTWEKQEQARPICLHANIEGVDFIYPFFLKSIHNYDLTETYYDIYTAYGYGGLICSNPHPSETSLNEINRLIDQWCFENRIVTEFIRENRIHDLQGRYLRDVEHVQVRTNVYANLKPNLMDELTKSRKRYLNIARRANLTCTIHGDGKKLDTFIEMYDLTMRKVKASGFYFFNREYFESVFRHLGGKVELIFVRQNSRPLSGAVCFYSGHYYIYHLGASDSQNLRAKPNDFLFYSIMKRGKDLGFRHVFFGGGTTDEQDDSLFLFKSKYGSLRYPCHIGRKVHLPDVYEKLCAQWKSRYPELDPIYGHILQKYRYTDQGRFHLQKERC